MPRRRPVVLTCAALAVLSSAGCGWPFVMDDAADPPVPAPATAPAPVSEVAPAPPAPVDVARAVLADRADGTDISGTLGVARLGPEPAPPPMSGWFPLDCDLPREGPASTTTVDVRFTNTSRGAMASAVVVDVELLGPGGGPPPAGAAVFVSSSAPDERWCQDGTTTPTADRLVAGVGGNTTVPVYVVSRDGAPLTGVVLRISGFEKAPDTTGPWAQVTAVSGGCPGESAALCVPLA
ncbi:hypothetical protein [Blastococcus sp. URHD0036]|uniref:hypothetical protein n=1 Tax=Blastococcus sp. URHD0036 TaxID=1380356 RepID=UPI00049548E5|nr:hypothetical protein [Blastococcus sp. URHD0036]